MLCYRYDSHVCFKVCKQDLITKRCGCPYAGIHYRKPASANSSFCFSDYCNVQILQSQLDCVKEFHALEETENFCGQCHQPQCHRWKYEHRHAAFGIYKGMTFADQLISSLLSNHTARKDIELLFGNISNIPIEFLQKNFIKISLSFNNIVMKNFTAVNLESPTSLLSELGGAFGFWIGFSMVTFLEIIEWLIRTVLSCCAKNETTVKVA